MSNETRTLYRSRSGWIFGVCQGLADYSGIHVGWVRLIVVVSAILTSFVPILLVYLVAAIFMRPAPVLPAVEIDDWEFYTSYASNRRAALVGLKRRLDHIERRTRRIETLVTDREYDWDRRLHSGV
jgi:phage shock protein C